MRCHFPQPKYPYSVKIASSEAKSKLRITLFSYVSFEILFGYLKETRAFETSPSCHPRVTSRVSATRKKFVNFIRKFLQIANPTCVSMITCVKFEDNLCLRSLSSLQNPNYDHFITGTVLNIKVSNPARLSLAPKAHVFFGEGMQHYCKLAPTRLIFPEILCNFLLQCGNVATPGHDEWCYADTVTLSVTHNHTENTGQEIADRKVNFVQLKTSEPRQAQHLRE